MKTCPVCQRAYDDNKSFCVYDGQSLVSSEEFDPLVECVIDNKYSIDYKIAEGGAGKIYHATHIQLQSVVAVKVLRQNLANDPVAIERFRREAYAAMKVRHPNAVAVLDFGITEDRIVYVVMELLIGQSLADRMKARGPLPLSEINTILQQVCAALSVAHARGIVHRDLKPENIFLQQENSKEVVKVVDFGIAKVQELGFNEEGELTHSGTVMGTPHYISPEQCSSQPIDGRADIYSLGIVLYQMLTGRVPFDGPSSLIVMLKQLNDRPAPVEQFRPGISQKLSAVVMHALEKDARSRPRNIESFAQELAAAIEEAAEEEFYDDLNRHTASLVADAAKKNYSQDKYTPPEQTWMGRKVRGSLSWFDIASAIHILTGLGQTGLLTIHKIDLIQGREGDVDTAPIFAWVYIEKGNITRAKLGIRFGREAFFQLFQMPLEGAFLFQQIPLPEDLKDTESIEGDGRELLTEALNLKTLLNRFASKFPDMFTSFHRQFGDLQEGDIAAEPEIQKLSLSLWQMLEQPGITLTELLARSPCCNGKTYQALAGLLAMGKLLLVRATTTGSMPQLRESDLGKDFRF